MTIECVLLTPTTAASLAGMTFPLYRQQLVSGDTSVVAFAAVRDGIAIGLVLARTDEASLLSLFVAAKHRRQGVGRLLLSALESELVRRGCLALHSVWTSVLPCADAYSALLRTQAWSLPQASMIIYKAQLARLREAHQMHPLATLPAGYAMVSWVDMSAEQISRLQQAILFESWIPPDLNPFTFATRGFDGAAAVPQLSFVLVAGDEVVGWNLVHHVDAQTVRASCTFVHPGLQRRMLLVPIYRELLDRALGTAYQHVSWTVAIEREALIKFYDRRMGPYLSYRAESWESHKLLIQSEADNAVIMACAASEQMVR